MKDGLIINTTSLYHRQDMHQVPYGRGCPSMMMDLIIFTLRRPDKVTRLHSRVEYKNSILKVS